MTLFADLVGLGRLQAMDGIAILVREHRDRSDAEFVGRAEGTDSDLTTICDQDFREHWPTVPGHEPGPDTQGGFAAFFTPHTRLPAKLRSSGRHISPRAAAGGACEERARNRRSRLCSGRVGDPDPARGPMLSGQLVRVRGGRVGAPTSRAGVETRVRIMFRTG